MTTAGTRRPFLTTKGIIAAVLVLAAAAVCVWLGFWQLDRLAERQARNAAVEEALDRSPLPLPGEGVALARSDPAVADHRPAEARGTFVPEGTLLMRGRFFQGRPGVHLVTPLRLEEGSLLLVNRGWVGAPDGVSAESVPPPPPGEQRVRGILQRLPVDAEGGRPLRAAADGAEYLTLRRLDLTAVRAELGEEVLPVYLQEIRAAPPDARPQPVPLQELDEGPHLMYAVQWFGFAAVFVVGLAVFVFLRWRRREQPRS